MVTQRSRNGGSHLYFIEGDYFMRKVIFLLGFSFIIVSGIFAQRAAPVRELNDVIKNGQVSLFANGNGGSSGSVVVGF